MSSEEKLSRAVVYFRTLGIQSKPGIRGRASTDLSTHILRVGPDTVPKNVDRGRFVQQFKSNPIHPNIQYTRVSDRQFPTLTDPSILVLKYACRSSVVQYSPTRRPGSQDYYRTDHCVLSARLH